jgi:hypothetical protein
VFEGVANLCGVEAWRGLVTIGLLWSVPHDVAPRSAAAIGVAVKHRLLFNSNGGKKYLS